MVELLQLRFLTRQGCFSISDVAFRVGELKPQAVLLLLNLQSMVDQSG